MNPPDNPEFAALHQARDELREGIESSRAIVRQSRVLIELLECDGAAPANDNDDGLAR